MGPLCLYPHYNKPLMRIQSIQYESFQFDRTYIYYRAWVPLEQQKQNNKNMIVFNFLPRSVVLHSQSNSKIYIYVNDFSNLERISTFSLLIEVKSFVDYKIKLMNTNLHKPNPNNDTLGRFNNANPPPPILDSNLIKAIDQKQKIASNSMITGNRTANEANPQYPNYHSHSGFRKKGNYDSDQNDLNQNSNQSPPNSPIKKQPKQNSHAKPFELGDHMAQSHLLPNNNPSVYQSDIIHQYKANIDIAPPIAFKPADHNSSDRQNHFVKSRIVQAQNPIILESIVKQYYKPNYDIADPLPFQAADPNCLDKAQEQKKFQKISDSYAVNGQKKRIKQTSQQRRKKGIEIIQEGPNNPYTPKYQEESPPPKIKGVDQVKPIIRAHNSIYQQHSNSQQLPKITKQQIEMDQFATFDPTYIKKREGQNQKYQINKRNDNFPRKQQESTIVDSVKRQKQRILIEKEKKKVNINQNKNINVQVPRHLKLENQFQNINIIKNTQQHKLDQSKYILQQLQQQITQSFLRIRKQKELIDRYRSIDGEKYRTRIDIPFQDQKYQRKNFTSANNKYNEQTTRNEQTPRNQVHQKAIPNVQISHSIQRNLFDENFSQIQSLINIFQYPPNIHSTPQQLKSMCIAAFKAFGVNLDSYRLMDIYQEREYVSFRINSSLVIIWQYTGLIYFGSTIVKRDGSLEKDGQGTQIINGCQVYKGHFANNRKNGYGIYINSKGERYKGNWKNGYFEGKGKLYNQYSKYEGYFKAGMKHGIGFQLFQNGDSYQGDYEDDKLNGKGKYIWKHKAIYKGDFKKGYMDGQGVWTSQNGDIYKGHYFKNMKHGFGIYQWNNGRVFQGNFEYGHKVSKTNNHYKGIILPQREISYDIDSNFDEESLSTPTKTEADLRNKMTFVIHGPQKQIMQRRNTRVGPYTERK